MEFSSELEAKTLYIVGETKNQNKRIKKQLQVGISAMKEGKTKNKQTNKKHSITERLGSMRRIYMTVKLKKEEEKEEEIIGII